MPSCLQVSKFYPPILGGIETVVRDLSLGLHRHGWDVEVLCSNTARESISDFIQVPITRAGTIAQVFSTSLSPSFAKQLRKRSQKDIIHLHLPNPMANIAALLTRFDGYLVVHWHSDIVRQKYLLKLYWPFQELLLRRADAIITTSPRYAPESPWLVNHLDKVHVVPNCINDPVTYKSPLMRDLLEKYIPFNIEDKNVVFSLGRMTGYKGFDVLISAAQYLSDDTVVLIGGDGELLGELRKLVRKKKLEKKVFLMGKLSDQEVDHCYKIADLFCLPSISKAEAFGVVLVEAMAWGKPIVATNIKGSGVNWVNIHGVTGYNAEPNNPMELSEMINSILSDQSVRDTMGVNGRNRFEENFTLEKMVNEVIQVYNTLG